MASLSVVIVAGGRGLRMGHEVPKQFLNVGKRPVLMHTIEKFVSFDADIFVVLVLPEDQFPYWEALCRKHHFSLPHKLVAGGEKRYDSVKNGLSHVGQVDLVAIHDGVRPFVSHGTIQRCFSAAGNYGAAIPVLEVVESIRKVERDKSWMRPRSSYRTVQTPQVFRSSILKKAYDLPYRSEFTDDASVVEAAGYEITLVEGNRENIKITSPFDLIVADAMIKDE